MALGTFVLLALVTVLFGNTVLGWKGTVTRLLPTPYLIVFFVYLGHQILYTNFGMLAFTENGELVSIEASSAGYCEISRQPVLGKLCWTTPV